MYKIIKLSTEERYEKEYINIPSVDNEEIIPRIKIYDYDGGYYFRRIGFNRKINDEGR
jgi:hypothetical protein